MTQSELIQNLSTRLEESQAEIKRILDVSHEVYKEVLDRDVRFTIPGLGTFFSSLVKKRKAFNPYHERFFLLPPKRVVRFHPSASLKEEVKTTRFENE